MNPIQIVDPNSPGSFTAAGGRPPPQAQHLVNLLGNIHTTSALNPVAAADSLEIEEGAGIIGRGSAPIICLRAHYPDDIVLVD